MDILKLPSRIYENYFRSKSVEKYFISIFPYFDSLAKGWQSQRENYTWQLFPVDEIELFPGARASTIEKFQVFTRDSSNEKPDRDSAFLNSTLEDTRV